MADFDNLFARIIEKPRKETWVPFPLKHPETNEVFNIPMWELTAEETVNCKAKAERKARAALKELTPGKNDNDDTYKELNNKYLTCEILAICARHPNDISKSFFLSAEQVLKLSITDMGILINHYMDIINDSPALISEGKMDDEALKRWSARVIEGGTQLPFLLNSFSWGAAKMLIGYLGDQLSTLQTPNSNSIESPESGI